MSFPTPEVPLRAVVFDLDGLIVNSEDLYEQSGQELLRRRGKVVDAALREAMMGRPAREALQVMIDRYQLSDSVESLAAETYALLNALMDTHLKPMPGLLALLETLAHARLPLAVATSGTRVFATDVLTRCQITDCFRFVLTAESVERGKPAPDVYQLAAAQLQLDPQEIMVLEDSANGCQAAVAAGTYAVAVPNDHTRDHRFPAVKFIADTLADRRIRAALGL